MNERGRLTHRAVGSLGFIPVMGGEVVKPAEDILAGHTRESGWRVGTRDESGGGSRRGHGYLEESAGTRRGWAEGGRCYKAVGASLLSGEAQGETIKSIYDHPIAIAIVSGLRLIRTPPSLSVSRPRRS